MKTIFWFCCLSAPVLHLIYHGADPVSYLFQQRTLTYIVSGSITVHLTSCLTGLDSTKQVNMLLIQLKQSSWILTSQTGGQPHSDTSPYELSECSLFSTKVLHCVLQRLRILWHRNILFPASYFSLLTAQINALNYIYGYEMEYHTWT